MAQLFTYGTLMFESVWQMVVGKSYPTKKAVLRGYAVFKIRDEFYPGIIKAGDGDSVPGLIYDNIDETVLRKLDRFEGEYYHRQVVDAAIDADNTVSAHTYIVKPQFFHILDCEKWTEDWFKRHGLERFLSSYAGFNTID